LFLSYFSRHRQKIKFSPPAFIPQTPFCGRTKSKNKLVSVLRKSISPENSFRKTESELKPRHTARILGGQNPKKKNVLSILEKIGRAQIRKARDIFSFWGCRVKRGGGGAFVERTD